MKLIKIVVLSVMMFCAGIVVAGQVDINKADAPTLALELKGIGEKKAQAIVDYRNQNGPFASLEDLQHVKGISTKTIENNKENITL